MSPASDCQLRRLPIRSSPFGHLPMELRQESGPDAYPTRATNHQSRRVGVVVTVEKERAGWWIASDGNHYPPELHPDYKPEPLPVPAVSAQGTQGEVRIGSGASFKRLRYGGRCVTCGTQIPKGGEGWHDPSISKVSCASCPPTEVGLTTIASEPRRRANPAGGTSALAVGRSRGDQKWVKGAAGEYLMAKALYEHLGDRVVILNDRAIPKSRANIDHVVVASSGVWIIDSKLWNGHVQVKSVGGMGRGRQRLLVDGRDHSSMTEKIYGQVIPIANVLHDPSIPIHPALVFLDANWGTGVAMRTIQKRPYEMLGVMVGWPRAIIAKIDEPGPLFHDAVEAIASRLDSALAPAE